MQDWILRSRLCKSLKSFNGPLAQAVFTYFDSFGFSFVPVSTEKLIDKFDYIQLDESHLKTFFQLKKCFYENGINNDRMEVMYLINNCFLQFLLIF